jgi:hypothetical protein
MPMPGAENGGKHGISVLYDVLLSESSASFASLSVSALWIKARTHPAWQGSHVRYTSLGSSVSCLVYAEMWRYNWLVLSR